MRTYTIGGNAVTVKKHSLNINDRLNERTTASLTVIEPTFEITKGMDVVIQDDSTVIFAGKVFKPIKQGDIIEEYIVRCTDYSSMIDKRIIAEAYDNTLAGNIVKDLITKYFSEEGITEGTIQDGLTISRAVFNYDNGNVAMNYIADVTGYYWEIDKNKKLNFFAKETYTAPFDLIDGIYEDLTIEEDSANYRNRQYVRGGYTVSTLQTRSFKGDGETQVFNLDLPIAEKPIIEINDVEDTDVGIRGLESGKSWYWSKNDKSISQEESDTPLTSSDTITIKFKGFYPLMIVAENSGQINDRKTLEGGSGIYESITQESSLETQDSALEYTNSLLQKYGFIPKVITFNTYESGLKAGQLLTYDSNQYLIESVTARDENNSILYSVKCLDGEIIGGWEKLFKNLVRNQSKLTIRENEILVKLITLKDSFINLEFEETMTFDLHQYWVCGTVGVGLEVIM